MSNTTLYDLTSPGKLFYVSQSRIDGAGNGLFAKHDIEPDTLLFLAFATKGDNVNRHAIQDAARALDANAKPSFDGEMVQLFPNDFVNHSKEPNCETAAIGDMLFVRSIRPIVAHEELTKNYEKTMRLITALGYELSDDFLNFNQLK